MSKLNYEVKYNLNDAKTGKQRSSGYTEVVQAPSETNAIQEVKKRHGNKVFEVEVVSVKLKR